MGVHPPPDSVAVMSVLEPQGGRSGGVVGVRTILGIPDRDPWRGRESRWKVVHVLARVPPRPAELVLVQKLMIVHIHSDVLPFDITKLF